MILLTVFIIISIITTSLYVYFIEYLNNNILFYTIPLVYLISFIGLFILLILFLSICLLFRRFRKDKSSPTRFYAFFTNQVATMVRVFFRIKLEVVNLDMLPKDQGFLLISNHQSLHDPIATIGLLGNYKISYIMKDGIMKLPFVGSWLEASGFLPIDRENDRNALKTILTASKMLSSGHSIGVYPEGTRSGSSEISNFKNGIFKMAQRAKVPIAVCLIDNFYNVRRNYPWKRTKALFKVCQIIPYDEIKDLHTNEIGKYCRDILIENQKKVRVEYSWIK